MPGKRSRAKSVYAAMENHKEKQTTLEDLNLEVLAKYNRLRPANERELREPTPQATPLWRQMYEDFQKVKRLWI